MTPISARRQAYEAREATRDAIFREQILRDDLAKARRALVPIRFKIGKTPEVTPADLPEFNPRQEGVIKLDPNATLHGLRKQERALLALIAEKERDLAELEASWQRDQEAQNAAEAAERERQAFARVDEARRFEEWRNGPEGPCE